MPVSFWENTQDRTSGSHIRIDSCEFAHHISLRQPTAAARVESLWGTCTLSIDDDDGSDVSVELEDGKIIIHPMRQALPGLDEDFARQLSEFIDEYRPALESLAR